MPASDLLHEAEADLAALAALPGDIRARVKAGLAELQRLRDAIDAAIAGMTGSATATLASLQAMAGEAAGAAAGQAGDPPPAGESQAGSGSFAG